MQLREMVVTNTIDADFEPLLVYVCDSVVLWQCCGIICGSVGGGAAPHLLDDLLRPLA